MVVIALFTGCRHESHPKTVSLPFEDFTSLTCNCPIKLTFSEKATKIVLTAEEDLIDAFQFKYDNGMLTISINNMIVHTWDEQPWVILPMPTRLSYIKFWNMVSMDADATIVSPSLTMDFSSAINIDNFDIDVDNLMITSWIYGTNINLSGKAEKVTLDLHSTSFDAFQLDVKDYNTTLWSSTAYLNCSDSLYVKTANSSTIFYKGTCGLYEESGNIINSSINYVKE